MEKNWKDVKVTLFGHELNDVQSISCKEEKNGEFTKRDIEIYSKELSEFLKKTNVTSGEGYLNRLSENPAFYEGYDFEKTRYIFEFWDKTQLYIHGDFSSLNLKIGLRYFISIN